MLQDYSIFDKFNFGIKPVGVKFLSTKPEGIKRLDKILDLCEMLAEAQAGSAFYATKDDFTCLGPLLLGMTEGNPIFESGKVGPKLGAFKDPRANRRIYQHIPRLGKDVVRYLVLSPLDKMTFEPDLLIITASVSQAEILLRAKSYTTGETWSARGTTVAGCAWVFIQPYLSGEANFTVTGLGFGMKARRLFPEGMILLTIPWDRLPGIIENLQAMDWIPASFTLGRDGHKENVKKIVTEVKRELDEGT